MFNTVLHRYTFCIRKSLDMQDVTDIPQKKPERSKNPEFPAEQQLLRDILLIVSHSQDGFCLFECVVLSFHHIWAKCVRK